MTYHLTQLASLDMEHISDDAKRLARAIYLKKKMYYNMRMKTLKRDATNIITKAQEMHQSKMKGFDDCVRTLLRLQKDMQCCRLRHAEAEAREAGQDEQPRLPRARRQRDAPRPTSSRATRARRYGDRIAAGPHSAIEQLLGVLRQRILEISVFSTSRVMVEFDTGGNVRLEEGKAVRLVVPIVRRARQLALPRARLPRARDLGHSREPRDPGAQPLPAQPIRQAHAALHGQEGPQG